MKELTIIRHAKSSWDNPYISDFDRPLNSRGKQNASMMGKILRDGDIMFDKIISSPANRAISTARTIAEAIGYSEGDIQKEPSFYSATLRTIISILKDLDLSVVHAAVFGHNPTFHCLVEKITDTTIVKFPTCAVASISLDIDTWVELKAGLGKLNVLRLPRDYMD